MRSGSHGDLDRTAEKIQEAEESFERVAGGSPAHQGRNLGLIESQNFRRPYLRQLPFRDRLADLLNESRFGEQYIRLGKAKVGKDVATAFFNPDGRSETASRWLSFAWQTRHNLAPRLAIENR